MVGEFADLFVRHIEKRTVRNEHDRYIFRRQDRCIETFDFSYGYRFSFLEIDIEKSDKKAFLVLGFLSSSSFPETTGLPVIFFIFIFAIKSGRGLFFCS